MNILYLIGNGFDLNLNLKTSYKDFYNFILEKNNEKDLAIVAKFKNEIKNKPTNWSDLELELGKFTAEIDSIEDANNLHDYLIDKLSSYLKLIEDNWDIEDIEKKKLINYLLSPIENRLLPVENTEINKFKDYWIKYSPWVVNIITFNYTKSIEKILEEKISNLNLGTSNKNTPVVLRGIEHIHGYVDKRMILGVNDVSQLINNTLHSNTETTDRYIKSNCNSTYGLGHENKCLEMIQSANLILIYGMSFGDTDLKWWKSVGDRLTNEALVILYVFDKNANYNGNQGAQINAHKNRVKNMFLSKTNLPQEKLNDAKTRIYVALNTDMFKLNIIEKNEMIYVNSRSY